MYKTVYILIFISSYLIFTASTCEQPVELDIEYEDPHLVLYAIMSRGNPIEVVVTRSWSVLDSRPSGRDLFPKTADVELWRGSDSIATLMFDDAQLDQPKYIHNFNLAKKTFYTIKASLDGFDPVSGVGYIPEQRKIEDFEATIQGIRVEKDLNFPYKLLHEYELTLDVEAFDNDSYYHVFFGYETEVDSSKRQQSFDIGNGIGNPRYTKVANGEGLLIDGTRLTNLTLNFIATAQTTLPEESISKIYTEVRSVSEDYYRFYETAAHNPEDSPYDQSPVLLHTNIENGYGFIGGAATDRDTIYLQ